jgi:cytochrome c oxidase subunit 3
MSVVYSQNKIHPYKFMLWLGCAGITMMFAAWTSAYLVRHAAGNWLEFKIPQIFFLNTLVILASSATLQLSYNAFKKLHERTYKIFLLITFLLGVVFIALQYVGWQELFNIGVPFRKNSSGDFLYTLTGFHVVHLIAGLAVLALAILHAFILPFKPTQKRILRLELTLTYWHFVDFLWIYLLLFLITQS